MSGSITFNPVITSNAAGSFNISSDGYIQGTMMDDPSSRNWLAGGVLAATETKPMWGGVAVSESIPSSASSATSNAIPAMGSTIIRATTLTALAAGVLTGFSTFNQAHHMISSPQSPVPLAGVGMGVEFFRMGTNTRIAVACDPALISLQTGLITQQVSWDFTNQVLQPFLASGGTQAVTSMTWSNANGGQVAVVMTAASLVGAVGDIISISGATNSGTGGNSIVNGSFTVNTFTDNQHFTFLLPAAAGVVATIAGTILLNYGVGALNVRVLDVAVGNSMTVSFNPVTGFATWNRSGSCALILI